MERMANFFKSMKLKMMPMIPKTITTAYIDHAHAAEYCLKEYKQYGEYVPIIKKKILQAPYKII